MDLIPQKKMLDMRYNEMCSDWGGTDDQQIPQEFAHGQLVLTWNRLTVSVEQTDHKWFAPSKTSYKQILLNVSGSVFSGTLLGVMGPSGSGKTTLMSTISHRTKGNFQGELLLNGKPISEKMMIKISGFVPQHDISFDQLTALEHLTFMAKCTMDRHTSKAKLEEHLDRIVRTLGMDRFLHTRISLLSGGERKKVSLAVQLLSDPPILFCDEITTGLDGYSAAHIVNTLKKVARTGKIVVCTIHQPASGVFRKFDEVVLLTRGRLAYHGPVSMVSQFFQRFGYVCPDMFNEADYVISILNSGTEIDKKNVDEMCQRSAKESQMIRINYDLFDNKKNIFSYEHQTQKPVWTTHFRLILDRSFKCFLRGYKAKLLELGVTLYLATAVSAPFSSIKLDKNAEQNLEGFWLISTIYLIAYVSFCTMSNYRVTYSSAVHREVHNSVYPLSVYYVSESMLSIVWVTVKTLVYCVTVFCFVGVEWNQRLSLVLAWFMAALMAFSYGSLVVSYFNRMENAIIFHTIYLCLSVNLSGAYTSLASLPKVLYYLRYFSIAFLGCETVSIVFWTSSIKTIPYDNVTTDFLDSGQVVLQKHGYISSRLHTDVLIMITFFIVLFFYCYYRVIKKMKKQPAY